MRPLLLPSLPRVRRDASTWQIGVPPGPVVWVSGGDVVERTLALLDGTRTTDELVTAVKAARADTAGEATDAAVRALVDGLHDAGVLDDQDSPSPAWRRLSCNDRDRLAVDARAWRQARPEPGIVDRAVAARTAAWVHIAAGGRVGTGIAVLLAAAGVGRITCADRSAIRAVDTAPLGPGADDVGVAAADVLRRRALSTAEGVRVVGAPGRHPDVVVVGHGAFAGGSAAPAPMLITDDAARRGLPHVHVTDIGGAIELGPFVIPGATACLRCRRLHRAARDGVWDQLDADADAHARPPAVDAVLATSAAARLAHEVLAQLDGATHGAAHGTGTGTGLVDAVALLRLPYGESRREEITPHPACGCRWPRAGAAPQAGAAPPSVRRRAPRRPAA